MNCAKITRANTSERLKEPALVVVSVVRDFSMILKFCIQYVYIHPQYKPMCIYTYPIEHYTRIAISGDRRDAFQAGKSPASMVTVSDRSHT